MLSQVEHKVKISHCRHICNCWLTNSISHMIPTVMSVMSQYQISHA